MSTAEVTITEISTDPMEPKTGRVLASFIVEEDRISGIKADTLIKIDEKRYWVEEINRVFSIDTEPDHGQPAKLKTLGLKINILVEPR